MQPNIQNIKVVLTPKLCIEILTFLKHRLFIEISTASGNINFFLQSLRFVQICIVSLESNIFPEITTLS